MSCYLAFRAHCVRLVLIFVCLGAVPSAVSAQTTALYLDSQPGDVAGGGKLQLFTPPTTTFTPMGGGAGFFFVTNGQVMTVTFRSVRQPLVVGTYENAFDANISPVNGLSVGSGCTSRTGRFVVLEAVYDASGYYPLKFAADFEQHCNDANPALFGAIRFNSSISSTVPFGGAYPQYRLRIAAPVHGHISGTGIDCGLGGLQCEVQLTGPSPMTLTATPEPGYVFLGWTGACLGSTTATINVNALHTCSALFDSTSAPSPHTVFSLRGDPGSLGGGVSEVLSTASTAWSISSNYSGLDIRVTRADGSIRWVALAAPGGGLPWPGVYESASSAMIVGRPRLDLAIGSSGCTDTGRFVVHELAFSLAGAIQRFSADFEQHCGDDTATLFGAIRYRATTASIEPFSGARPPLQLSIVPPLNGRVTGPGLDCSGAGASCSTTLPAAGPVTLTAVPDAGYLFAGWSGDCSAAGSTSAATVAVVGPRVCAATFELIAPAGPRSLLILDSQIGDAAGGGRRHAYSSANSEFTVGAFTYGDASVTIRVDGSDGRRWDLRFAPPSGQQLTPGTYSDVRSVADPRVGGGLAVNCSSGATGRFVVHEIDFAPGNRLESFAADFEQHCGDAEPGLFGTLRYNSATNGVEAFGGNYPELRLAVEAAGGRVTGPGIDCSSGAGTCERVLTAADHLTLSATAGPGYLFAGWNGSCFGGETVTVHVNGPKRCVAVFEPLDPVSPRTVLALVSQAGDRVGGGQRQYFSPANSVWSVTSSSVKSIRLSIRSMDNVYWTAEFSAPSGSPTLAPGLYSSAIRTYSSTANFPGLAVTANSNCTRTEGRFLVHEIAFDNSGQLQKLAVDFEQHCDGATSALFGALRYNSAAATLQPFGGGYPSYRLSTARPAHGTVLGAGLNCSAASALCEATLSAPAPMTLQARPDRGYVFAGWTGACAGSGLETSVMVYGERQCDALFLPIASAGPVSMLSLSSSSTAETIGRGGRYFFVPGNSTWSVSGYYSLPWITIDAEGPLGDAWRMTFQAAEGTALTRGPYIVSPAATTGPRIAVERSHYCSSSSVYGSFVVHDFAMANGIVQRAAIDFTIRCGSATAPPLTGILRVNSTVAPRPMPWGVRAIAASMGAGGGPQAQTFDAAGGNDGGFNLLAYDQNFTGGVNIAYGDVDGDGVADLVTAPGSGGGPHVRIFSSTSSSPAVARTTRELAGFFAYAAAFTGGVNLAVGDVTGDGIAEIITAPGAGGGPHVRVFQVRPPSSTSSSPAVVELTGFLAYAPSFTGGVRVAVGDVDGDGTAEVITAPGAGGGPHVRAFTIAGSVREVRSFLAYGASFTGGLFVAAGDVNGDGQDDIITGPDAGGGPHVRVFSTGVSASDVSEIAGFLAYAPQFTGGVRVAAADLDADGRAEIVVGAGPGGGPHVMALRRGADGNLSLAASFLAYAPTFAGGVFVSGATR